MKTILLVEDELTIAEVLTEILSEAGYRVVSVGNGREALDCMDDVRPDLVLSDMMMPLMSGRELCRRIQDDPQHSALPVVLMSSAYGVTNLDDCKYAAFLNKPFALDKLLATVSKLIGE